MLLFRPSQPLPAAPSVTRPPRPKCLHPEWCDGKNHHYQERDICNACFRYERAKYKAMLAETSRLAKERLAKQAQEQAGRGRR